MSGVLSTQNKDAETFKAMLESFKNLYGPSRMPSITTSQENNDTWVAVLRSAGYDKGKIGQILTITSQPEPTPPTPPTAPPL